MQLYSYYDAKGTGKFIAYFIDEEGRAIWNVSGWDKIYAWCLKTFGKPTANTWYSSDGHSFLFKRYEDLNWFMLRWS